MSGQGSGAATSAQVIPSPNIWDAPEVYELENRACDPDRLIESAMADLHPLAGADLLDIGCGAGFHLPRFAALGARVTGAEPHPPLVSMARERVAAAGLDIEVHLAGAACLPLPAASVDIAHARWAYFFGAGCEPGLAELGRVMRPGGVACVVDNDVTRSTFGGWFARAYPAYDPVATERFWRRVGWQARRLTIRWQFERRADLARVVAIELPPRVAEQVLQEHPGTEVDYGVTLRWRRF